MFLKNYWFKQRMYGKWYEIPKEINKEYEIKNRVNKKKKKSRKKEKLEKKGIIFIEQMMTK